MYLMNNNPCIQYIMRYINQQFKSLSSTSPGDHQTPAAVVAVARRRPCCEVKQGRWVPEACPATVLRGVFEPYMPYIYHIYK